MASLRQLQPRLPITSLTERADAQTLSPTPFSFPLVLRQAISAFEAKIGGRAALIEALSVAETTPVVQKILCRIADPKYSQGPGRETRHLAYICAEEGITPGQLFTAFQTAVLHTGQVLAAAEAAKAAPEVVKEVVKQALPHEDCCPTCDGLTTIVPRATRKTPNPTPIPCPACKGRGVIKVKGKYDQQITALEIAGVLTKTGGVHVVQNTVVTPPPTGLSLDALQQAVGEILYAAPTRSTATPIPVVDAEPSEST